MSGIATNPPGDPHWEAKHLWYQRCVENSCKYPIGSFLYTFWWSLRDELSKNSCNISNTEELRIAADRAAHERSDNVDALERNNSAVQAIAEREQEALIRSEAQSTDVCDRACAALRATVIRSLPCMCGRGSGGLLVFNDDFSAVTHVREVESLNPGPAAPVSVAPEAEPAAEDP